MGVWKTVVLFVRALVVPKCRLAVENLALRQQLAVYNQSIKRPRLRPRDRLFWVWLSKFWSEWSSALVIVKPETVVRWHRQGFRLYWRWKSRTDRPGRPRIDQEVRDLIRQMSRENPTWGAPRIRSELKLLGYSVAERTVAKYMVRTGKPPSQTWKTFLKNHLIDLAAIDFFTVPTATFRVLYCFIVLRHDRRRVIHFNVTEHPSAHGRPSRSLRPIRSMRPLVIRSATGMVFSETNSRNGSIAWASTKFPSLPVHLGRIPTVKG